LTNPLSDLYTDIDGHGGASFLGFESVIQAPDIFHVVISFTIFTFCLASSTPAPLVAA
jgi:hypothetical protein